MNLRYMLRALVCALMFSTPPLTTSAEGSLPAAAQAVDIFRSYSDRIVQVRIIEGTSGTKAVLGSGFLADEFGDIVTNYHVVSNWIFYPERYQIKIVGLDGKEQDATLRAFDIVHDLAVLKITNAPGTFFELDPAPLQKGEKLYAMGNPMDLGFTIIEGTYSGLVENSLYDKIHFTGSLNPGLSGGPTITGEGKVRGVNVSTAGNQMSFLVPARFVIALLEEAHTSPLTGEAYLKVAAEQLARNQDGYTSQILGAGFNRLALGDYQAPVPSAPVFHCWSNSEDEPGSLYKSVSHTCSLEDDIYIHDASSVGLVKVAHRYLSSGELNRFQFYDLYESRFLSSYLPGGGYMYYSQGDEDYVTNYRCTSDFVELGGGEFRVIFCARASKKLDGLYEMIVSAASINENFSGLISTLTMTGISYENGERLMKAYLSGFSWKK